MTTAAERWHEDLASWAIPPEILERAPESPWCLPVELFAGRAVAPRVPSPSNLRALDALPGGGSVLDVGCGGGAASVPLAGRAGRLVGTDVSEEMLAAFRERVGAAATSGTVVETILGTWPDVAAEVPVVDVVASHHVVYNAPDLGAFALALSGRARRRVVLELPPRHPVSDLNDLWLRFHGLRRPERPTADDAVAVLREAGIDPEREDWTSAEWRGGFSRREDVVAFARRRLCLTPDRDPEVAEAIADRVVERDGRFGFPPRDLVTLWWEGRARG